MPNNRKKEKYISLLEAARIYGCTQKHMALMAREKKLRAVKLGRNWFTTLDWLKGYSEAVEENNKKKQIEKASVKKAIFTSQFKSVFRKAVAASIVSLLIFAFISTAYIAAKEGSLSLAPFEQIINKLNNLDFQSSNLASVRAFSFVRPLCEKYLASVFDNLKPIYQPAYSKVIKPIALDIANTVLTVIRGYNKTKHDVFTFIDNLFTKSGNFVINLISNTSRGIVKGPSSFGKFVVNVFQDLPRSLKKFFAFEPLVFGFPTPDISEQSFITIKDLYKKLSKLRKELGEIEKGEIIIPGDTIQNITVVKKIEGIDQETLDELETSILAQVDAKISAIEITDFSSMTFHHDSLWANIGSFSTALGTGGAFSAFGPVTLGGGEETVIVDATNWDVDDNGNITANDISLATLTASGDITATGNITGSGTLAISGQATFTGLPSGAAVSEGSVYINPSTASSSYTLFGIAVGGTEKLRLDAEGDLFINGSLAGASTSFSELTLDKTPTTVNTPVLLMQPTNVSGSWATGSATFLGINASTSFTGDFANFRIDNTSKFFIDEIGNLGVAGVGQFGGISTLSYSRFGIATTSYSLADSDDLLISGMLELDESAWFDSTVSISGDFEIGDGLLVANPGLGQILIGTSSFPAGVNPPLYIEGRGGTEVHIKENSEDYYSALVFGNDSGTWMGGIWLNSSNYTAFGPANAFEIYNGLNAPITFYTNATEQMRLTESGFLGINDAAPGAMLEIQDNDSETELFAISSSSVGDYFVVKNTGNVGIGTTGPAEKLDIEANGSDVYLRVHEDAGTHTAGIKLREGTSDYNIMATSGSELVIQSLDVSRNIRFETNGEANHLYLQDGGNVGIGTTSPEGPLHISDAVNQPTILKASTTAGDAIWEGGLNNDLIIKSLANTAGEGIKFQDDEGTDMLFIETGGNTGYVGIGTTSPSDYVANKLVVADTGTNGITIRSGTTGIGLLYFADGNTGSDRYRGYVRYDHSNERLELNANSGAAASNLVLTQAGNVGIGTVSPATLFEIEADGLDDGSKAPTIQISNLRDTDTHVVGSTLGALDFYSQDTSGVAFPGVGAFVRTVHETIQGYKLALTFGTASMDTAVQEFMRIDSSGNVGIGTTSPHAKLDVMTGTTGNDMNIIFEETAANEQRIIFQEAELDYFALHHDGSGITPNNKLIIQAADGVDGVLDVDALTILQSGNIGIGTTSPMAYEATSTKLHVDGGGAAGTISEVARFEGANDGENSGGIIRLGTSNDWGIYMEGGRGVGEGNVYGAFGTTDYEGNKTEVIRIDNNGNVGIGDTTPAALLDVGGGTVNYIDGTDDLLVKDDIELGGDLYVGGSTYFGSVSSLSGTLEITTNGTVDDQIKLTDSSTAPDRTFGIRVNDGDFQLYDYGTTSTRFHIASASGNVGIGTTNPDYKLHVAGIIYNDAWYIGSDVIDSYNAGGAYLRRSTSGQAQPQYTVNGDTDTGIQLPGSNIVTISTGGTEKIRIDSSGNLGIGTTNLTQKFEVAGTASISTDLYVHGSTWLNSTASVSGKFEALGNTTLGDATSDLLVVNAYIASNLIPNNSVRYIGTSDLRWDFGYFDELHVTSMSAQGTTISGTKTESFTINSDNETNDTEDAFLTFERGDPANASLKWDSTNDRFHINFPLEIEDNDVNTELFAISSSSVGDYFVVKNDGKAGIGTTAPEKKLEVDGGDSWFHNGASGAVYIGATAETAPLAYIGDNGDFLKYYSYWGHQFHSSAGNEIMRLQRDGKVGIGTASPSYNLHVEDTDNTRILSKSTDVDSTADISVQNDAEQWQMKVNGDISDSFSIRDAAGDHRLVILPNSGNVGIGTTNPSSSFHVYDDEATGSYRDTYAVGIIEDTDGRLQIRSSDAGTYGSGIILSTADRSWGIRTLTSGGGNNFEIGYRTSTEDEAILDAITEMFTIASTGNVGIGETSPNYKLDVEGTSNFEDTMTFDGDSTAAGQITYGASGFTVQGQNNENLNLWDDSGNGITVEDGGNVGIGTATPKQELHIAGSLILAGESTDIGVANGNNLQIGTWNADYSAYTDWMTILNTSGYVGIGNTTPALSLEVGDITLGVDAANGIGVQGDLEVEDFALLGALRVGSTGTDPGAGNAYLEGNLTVAGTKFSMGYKRVYQVAYKVNVTENSKHEVRIPWPSTTSGPIILDVEVLIDTGSVATKHYVRKRFYLTSYDAYEAGKIYSQSSYVADSLDGSSSIYNYIGTFEEDTINDEIVLSIYSSSSNGRSNSVILTAWGTGGIADLILDATHTADVETGITPPDRASVEAPPNDDFIVANSVGIGTTTPAAKLSINGGLHVGGDSDPGDNNALIDNNLTVGGTLAWAGTSAPWATSDVDASGLYIELDGSDGSNDVIRLQTSPSGSGSNYARLKIDPDSGVSITRTGTGGQDLSVGGNLTITGNNLYDSGADSFWETSGYATNKTVSGISSDGTISYANISLPSTQLTDGGTIGFDWVDDEVSDTLTIGNAGSVDADALACDVGDDDLISEDCIGDVLDASEIENIYVFNTSDTMSGSLSVGTTLGVTGATTLTGLLTANGGITADGGVFTVADDTGAIHTGNNLDVDGVITAGTTPVTLTGATGYILETAITQNSLDDSEIEDNSLSADSLAANSVADSELMDSGDWTTSGNICIGAAADALCITTDGYLSDEDDAVTVNDALSVTGAATLTGLLTANGGITADGGVFTVADDTGAIHTGNNLDVDGVITAGTTPVTLTGATGYILETAITQNSLDSTEIEDIYVFNTSDTMSGSLGVGTVLTVGGDINATGNTIEFGETAQTIQDIGDYLTIWDQASYYFNFHTGGALAGRFGIGDNSPDYTLDVGGSAGIGTEGTQLLISTDGYLSDVDDVVTINDDLDVVGGDITSTNTMHSDANATMPHIVLDSISDGDAWTAQGAYISLGESGDLGSAALHMTYVGSGYGYIGSGAVTSGIPGASYLRFDFDSDNIYTPDTLTVGDLSCTNCINDTEITDIYVFNTSDTMSGSLSVGTTLGVTGATTLTGLLTANGGITADAGAFTVANTSGNIHTSGTLDVDGLITAGTTPVTLTNAAGYIVETAIAQNTLDSTEIEDIYVFNTSDTMSGTLGVGSTLTVTGAIDANSTADFASTVDIHGTLDMNSQVISGVNYISTLNESDYDKLRVYGSGSYTIGMHSGMTYGGLNDWAMTFTMNNESDRGWVWRDESDAVSDGAMSLTTAGVLTVKSNTTVTGDLTIQGDNLDSSGAALVINNVANQPVYIGGGTPNVATGDNDFYVTGILEVDEELEVDGPLDVDSTSTFANTLTIASGVNLQFADAGTYIDGTATSMTIESDDTLAMNADTSVTVTSPIVYIGDMSLRDTGANQLSVYDSDGNQILLFDEASSPDYWEQTFSSQFEQGTFYNTTTSNDQLYLAKDGSENYYSSGSFTSSIHSYPGKGDFINLRAGVHPDTDSHIINGIVEITAYVEVSDDNFATIKDSMTFELGSGTSIFDISSLPDSESVRVKLDFQTEDTSITPSLAFFEIWADIIEGETFFTSNSGSDVIPDDFVSSQTIQNSEGLFIDPAAGFVEIGTASTSYELIVNGTTSISEDLHVGNKICIGGTCITEDNLEILLGLNIASSSGTVEDNIIITYSANPVGFLTSLVDGLKELGVTIKDGIINAAKLVVDEVKTKILRANTISITVEQGQDNTIGSATIPRDSMEYFIENSLVEEGCKIFISFTSNTAGRTWYISEKRPGEGFIVNLSEVTTRPLDFDYWIIFVEGSEDSDDTSDTNDTNSGGGDVVVPETEPEVSSSSESLVPEPEPEVASDSEVIVPETEPETASSSEPIVSEPEPEVVSESETIVPEPEPETASQSE